MEPGSKIIASSKLYGGSITQFTKTFKNFSWEAELVDVSDLDAVRLAVKQPEVRALFAESLANPDGNISDISSLADIAHNAGIPLIIDNTMATPIICQPGKFGADLIIYSTTKFLSGHGNAMGGAVVDMGKFKWDSGRKFSKLTEPDSSYHDMKNAEIIAKFLNDHPKVSYVSWAGFKNNSYHQLAKKYFNGGFGSVFTFSLKGDYDAAVKLVESCNLISHLANIGDTKSLIIHPASTTHRQLSDAQKEKSGIKSKDKFR